MQSTGNPKYQLMKCIAARWRSISNLSPVHWFLSAMTYDTIVRVQLKIIIGAGNSEISNRSIVIHRWKTVVGDTIAGLMQTHLQYVWILLKESSRQARILFVQCSSIDVASNTFHLLLQNKFTLDSFTAHDHQNTPTQTISSPFVSHTSLFTHHVVIETRKRP